MFFSGSLHDMTSNRPGICKPFNALQVLVRWSGLRKTLIFIRTRLSTAFSPVAPWPRSWTGVLGYILMRVRIGVSMMRRLWTRSCRARAVLARSWLWSRLLWWRARWRFLCGSRMSSWERMSLGWCWSSYRWLWMGFRMAIWMPSVSCPEIIIIKKKRKYITYEF